jgi:hypothetical protein
MNAHRVLVGKPEGRSSQRWEDYIKMDIREIGWGGTDRIHLAQDRDQWWALVNMVMNHWVAQKVQTFSSS